VERAGQSKEAATINNFANGGLNLTDLNTFIKSLILAWIAKLSNAEPSPWKSYLKYLLKHYGEFFFLHCNYNIHDYDIESVFYSEMLQWWSEFRSTIATESASYKSIIWNNCNIRINDTPIYYHSYLKAGVIFVSDLMFSLSNIESFSIAKQNGLIGSNYLTWSGARCSIPKQLRNLHVNGNVLRTLEFTYGNKSFDPATSKSKDFYALLIQKKSQAVQRFFQIDVDI